MNEPNAVGTPPHDMPFADEKRPEFCLRCGAPLYERREPGGYDATDGTRAYRIKLSCERFKRPWWLRLGRPATYHDVYSIGTRHDGSPYYNLNDWR